MTDKRKKNEQVFSHTPQGLRSGTVSKSPYWRRKNEKVTESELERRKEEQRRIEANAIEVRPITGFIIAFVFWLLFVVLTILLPSNIQSGKGVVIPMIAYVGWIWPAIGLKCWLNPDGDSQ